MDILHPFYIRILKLFFKKVKQIYELFYHYFNVLKICYKTVKSKILFCLNIQAHTSFFGNHLISFLLKKNAINDKMSINLIGGVLMAILKLVLAFFLSFGQIVGPLFVQLTKGEDVFFEEWSKNSAFTEESYVEIEKTPGKDFVILNLTDIQLGEENVFAKEGEYTKELITKLVNDKKPDLITLSGDNAWGYISYLEVIEFIDSFGIPWAPVMGNHDGEGTGTEFWAAYTLTKAENCLFKFGPKDMGYGNYIINITENKKIVHTLFMMDTHSSADFEVPGEGLVEGGYDHLWDNQLEWYKWAVNGIKALNDGNVVESTVILHIPLREYIDAWDAVSVNKTEEKPHGEGDAANDAFLHGNINEDWCPSPVNNGFFDLCKSLGSTKTIICGHDHKNDSAVMYEGICLAYALKSGFGSYWLPEMIGGTTITINSAGSATVENHYYDLAENNWDIVDD